jgi:hypothetical protein
MREFYLGILLLYFGYKLFMGLVVVINWDTPAMVEVRKEDNTTDISIYYRGVFENVILMGTSYLLY